MDTTRRAMLKIGAYATGAALLPGTKTALAHSATTATKPDRAEKPLRILILGGTGFTGPHQVRYALARGHSLTLFNRGRRPQQWPGDVTELVGDRNTGDLDALRDGEWDVCIDNPTSLPFWVRDAGAILKERIGHYIFISTLSVYATNDTPGRDETDALAEYGGTDPMKETLENLRADMALYGPLKARSEKEAHAQFGDAVTIIRPGLIVGPGDETDRFTYWPVRLARGGDVLAPGDGRDPIQFIDARDLAEWTIRMAEARAFGTFNAMGPDYRLEMAAFLHGVRAVTTAGATLHWVSMDFLDRHKVSAWGDMPVWVPGQGDSAGFATRSNSKAVASGLRFRPLATTAADTLAWYETWPAERRDALRAGLSADREAEVLAAWRDRSSAS